MQYVYMLRAGEKHYKVGVASNIKKRVDNIQTSNAERIEVVTTIIVKNANEVEQLVHQRLKAMRANGGKEWFVLEPKQAIDLAVHINDYADNGLRFELNDKIVLGELLTQNKVWKKSLEKKLELIVNNYQKSIPKLKEYVDEPLEEYLEPITKVKFVDDLEGAMMVFMNEGRASTSLLQRKLSIGYGKAARIVEKLEEQGKISKPNGSKPRRVLALMEA